MEKARIWPFQLNESAIQDFASQMDSQLEEIRAELVEGAEIERTLPCFRATLHFTHGNVVNVRKYDFNRRQTDSNSLIYDAATTMARRSNQRMTHGNNIYPGYINNPEEIVARFENDLPQYQSAWFAMAVERRSLGFGAFGNMEYDVIGHIIGAHRIDRNEFLVGDIGIWSAGQRVQRKTSLELIALIQEYHIIPSESMSFVLFK